MGEVTLGVELVLPIDAALDFTGTQGLDHGRNSGKEIIRFFFTLDAGVQRGRDFSQALLKSALGPLRNLIAHQKANGVQLLPLILEGKKRAYFKIARRNINRLRQLAPVRKVIADLPLAIAVIDDEEFRGGF